jgi:hypothetical protein
MKGASRRAKRPPMQAKARIRKMALKAWFLEMIIPKTAPTVNAASKKKRK